MRLNRFAAPFVLLITAAGGALAGNDQSHPSSVTGGQTALLTPPGTTSEASSSKLTALTDAELATRLLALKSELARRQKLRTTKVAAVATDSPAPPPKKGTTPASPQTNPAAYYQKQLLLREYPNLYVNETHVTSTKPAASDPCNPQRFFIRANSLDNYLYGITPANKAQGASVSYTDDRVANTQTATINGMVSYVALRDLCPTTPAGDAPFISAYSIAPYVQGQGNYTEPHVKSENSELKFGVENQVEISRGLLPRQVFTVAPYVATDYRGEAQIVGSDFYIDSYDPDLHLGGYINDNPYLGWFLQVREQVDIRDVSAVGVTGLSKTSYEWLGATAALNMYFFPSTTSVPAAFRNTIAFYGSANYFYDARSGMEARLYTAKLAYKIPPDGTSSIALEYDDGTDKDTLVYTRKYLASITYAY